MFVPDPARNLFAVRALNYTRIMQQRGHADAPRKNKESEANKVKCCENSCRAPERAVAPDAARLVPAGKNIEGREQRRLVETVKNVVRLDSVPHAHQSKRQKIAEDRGGVFAGKPFAARGRKQEAHVNVVAKPKRKRDVPAVPEIADVSGEKRPVEIFRRMDAKEKAERDGK